VKVIHGAGVCKIEEWRVKAKKGFWVWDSGMGATLPAPTRWVEVGGDPEGV